MRMSDVQKVPAPQARVWAALNDPEVLRRCIPGCESLDKTSPTEMVATVVVKVGPVKGSFSGKVALSDLDPPDGYRISGEGAGGVAGFAKGGAVVRLEADGPYATLLHYDVNAAVGGKLASLERASSIRRQRSWLENFSQISRASLPRPPKWRR